MVVDTFKFPSACVCMFKETDLLSFRSVNVFDFPPSVGNAPVCQPEVSTKKLKTLDGNAKVERIT
jgi:hypothetical protein